MVRTLSIRRLGIVFVSSVRAARLEAKEPHEARIGSLHDVVRERVVHEWEKLVAHEVGRVRYLCDVASAVAAVRAAAMPDLVVPQLQVSGSCGGST